MRIVGIAGSLRSGSFNAALLRAALEECPPGAILEIESIRGAESGHFTQAGISSTRPPRHNRRVA